MKFIHLYWLILCLFSSFIQAQEDRKIKESIGWETYAYHISGDIYKIKKVCQFNQEGNCLSCTSKYKDNINTTFLGKYDDKNRLVYKFNLREADVMESEIKYEYHDKSNYYTEEAIDITFFLRYYYLNNNKQIIEKKTYLPNDSYNKKDLEEWIIYTYNKNNLLIGKRYKTAKSKELSKEIYRYKKGTSILEKIERYYWDKDKQKEQFKEDKTCSYTYNSSGKLIKIHDRSTKDSGRFEITTYQYKNGKLWIEKTWDKYDTYEVIYKNGIKVVSRTYAKDSGRNVNGVKDLMSETYYDYIYYEE